MVIYQVLVIAVVSICFICSVLTYLRAREKDIKAFYIGAAFFFLLFGICRVFYFIYDFVIRDPIYWTLGAIIGIISIIFLLFAIEKTVIPKTKFVFTIIATIILILYIIPFPITIHEIIQTIMIPLIAPLIPIIYLYVAIKNPGEARKFAFLFFIGSILFILANLAHSQLIYSIDWLYFITSPILFISSMLILAYVITQQGK